MSYVAWSFPSSLLLVALALLGCDDGAQHGRFVVSGSSSHVLSGVTGDLTLVRGNPTPLSPQSTGEQALLYILTIAPGVEASGGGSSGKDGRTVSEWKWRWQTSKGEVAIALSWDRESDQVTAAGRTFNRQRGNAFVLVRDASGKVAVTQVGPLQGGLDIQSALGQIQSASPADSPARGVSLH